ncbi:MAG: hypothetical protein IJL02_10325 [Methanobrevibacter sp.]|uniref:hypothetical protein n=1 Tax=Methanobrevibacter sp. TaxID=66852 RepID=UPI0025E69628|nr:hypothetical protein [Methanobrevibacter sp.]MBQ6100239.1 hypothetical protein [Methanobrevibacter sp.]
MALDKKNIILVAIVILVIALVAVAAYVYTSDNTAMDITNNTTTKTVINIDKANDTVVGDNSTRVNETNNTNATYKVYNPQSDSYVTVIGEKFDEEVNRWYTYDEDGVRYYNTRIK